MIDKNKFVDKWNKSESIGEVAEYFEMSYPATIRKGYYLRSQGLDVKKMYKPKGSQFWVDIGRMGGSVIPLAPRGFATMSKEKVAEAGRKGGTISRRTDRVRRPRKDLA